MQRLPAWRFGSLLILGITAITGSACHPRISPVDTGGLSALLRREALGSPEARPFLDLGAGLPLVFTERQGASRQEFTVNTLGKDSLAFDTEGFTLRLGDGSGVPAASLRAEIVRSGPGGPLRGAEPARSLENRLFGSNPRSWQTATPTFSGLRYGAIGDGLEVVYTINSRALRSTYRVAAGADPGQIRLRWPDLQGAIADPVTGRVQLVVSTAGRTRALTLLPPRVTQGKETLPARYAVDGKTVGVAIDRYDRAAALEVVFELAYGDISHDYDARSASHGGSFVVRSVASSDGPGRNDILLARIDADGRLLSTTVVGGSGDDIPLGLTVGSNGNVYVTGKTSSRDFPLVQPLQRENGGGYDAFVLVLDPNGQRLLTSTYLGGSGDDTGEGIALDSNNGLYLAGRGRLDCAAVRTGRTSFATVFPRLAEGEARADYFLVRVPVSLDRLLSAESFSAPKVRGALAVWTSLPGVPVVGVFTPTAVSCNPGTDQVYQMSHLGDPAFDSDPYVNYSAPGSTPPVTKTGWGYHALRWKAIGNPSIPYSAAAATNIPKTQVHCGDEGQLNSAEAASPVFATDPGGVWQCYQHTGQEHLGLAAAFYMHRFASPVYTKVKTIDINYNYYPYAFAVEKVTFCAVGPGTLPQPVDQMCNFNNIDPTLIQPNCLYGNSAYYVLKELKGRSWGRILTYYLPAEAHAPDYGDPWYNKWYLPGDYIGDPPADQAALLPYIQDAARQLAGRMLTERELEITIHPALGATRTSTFTGLVRPSDL